jgi:uncharacterized protein (TIGR00251 family)
MGKLKEIVKKHQDGAILNLFVTPDTLNTVFPAGINEWRKCIEIKVKSPAVNNRANKEVIKTVAKFFKKSVHDVYILTGDKNSKKTIVLKGVTTDFVSDKLRESLNGL